MKTKIKNAGELLEFLKGIPANTKIVLHDSANEATGLLHLAELSTGEKCPYDKGDNPLQNGYISELEPIVYLHS